MRIQRSWKLKLNIFRFTNRVLSSTNIHQDLVLKKTPPNSNSKSNGIFDLRDASRFLCVLGKTFIAKLKGLGYKREIPSSEKVSELPTEIKRSRETNKYKYIACELVTSCSICCAIRNEIFREQLFGFKARNVSTPATGFLAVFVSLLLRLQEHIEISHKCENVPTVSWISRAGSGLALASHRSRVESSSNPEGHP